MSDIKGQNQEFLLELYRLAQGDTAFQVSMYDVGASIGLDRGKAGVVAEELIVDGLVDLVNLSGGISITIEGLKKLNMDLESGKRDENFVVLGDHLVLEAEESKAVEAVLVLYRNTIQESELSYSMLEEIIFDIKTAEIQLFSSKPKMIIIKSILKSLAATADSAGLEGLAGEIEAMTGK